ncbi:hypothetical protein Ddye_032790 [Dipteronia dyeriana]|uniref:Uncharacterized protein n=1 Tax=Dipteronia dyeriana TaxID=168575 RepID=A0AAD9WJN8_9ROSI|nr:hypothetical protein Ddye_032790 [Dipteronia dyeriana]
MAHTVCELLWLKSLLQELKVFVDEPMRLYDFEVSLLTIRGAVMGWLEIRCYSTFTTSLSGGALGQSSGTLWGQGDSVPIHRVARAVLWYTVMHT